MWWGKGVALASRVILEDAAHALSLGYPWEAGTQDLDKAASVKAMMQGRTPWHSSGSSGVLWRLQTVSYPFPLYCSL